MRTAFHMATENVNGQAVRTALATKDGLYMGTLNTAQPSGGPGQQMDMSDPNVKKLVYNLYRGLLGTYNEKANDVIASNPDAIVNEDQGIAKQIESMMRQSSEIQTRNGVGLHPTLDRRGSLGANSYPTHTPIDRSPSLGANQLDDMSAPPPPPPLPPGSILAPRSSDVHGHSPAGRGNTPASHGPPSAIAGAMMRDKRPFTYTPGGLDLSEIRSPRMAKRISKNALSDGVVAPQQVAPSPLAASELPPQALAAMQPQIAVPVFPQAMPQRQESRIESRPLSREEFPPPPPPLPSVEQAREPKAINAPEDLPKINPEIVRQLNNHLLAQIPNRAASPAAAPPPPPPEPPGDTFSKVGRIEKEKSPTPASPSPAIIEREKSPVKPIPVNGYSRTQSHLQSPDPKPVVVQLSDREKSPATAPPPPVRQSSAQVVLNVSQPSPQPPSDIHRAQLVSESPRPQPVNELPRPQIVSEQPRPQPVSEPVRSSPNNRYDRYSSHSDTSDPSPSISPVPNGTMRKNAQMGSLYIPPVEKQVEPDVSVPVTRLPYNSPANAPAPPSSSIPFSPASGPQSPPSAQLKNSPMPWMNSSGKSQSPPPPWVVGDRESSQPKVRIIPIQMEGSSPPPSRQQMQPPQTPPQGSGNTRIIPIQVEGRDSYKPTQFANNSQFESPQSPSVRLPVQQQKSVQKNQMRVPPAAAAEPQEVYNQVVAHLDNMHVGGESPINAKQGGVPTQSRSFRILQLITDTTDESDKNDTIDHTPREAEVHTETPSARRTSDRRSSNSSGSSYQGLAPNMPQERRLVLEEGDKELMDLFKQKVNEDMCLHGRADPRYKGSHIPSKTFRMLQNFTADSPEGGRREQRSHSSEDRICSPDNEPVLHTDQLTLESSDMSDLFSPCKRGSQIVSDTLSTRLHQLLSLAHGAASSLLNTVENAGEEKEGSDDYDADSVEDQPLVIHRWHQDMAAPESSMYIQETAFQKPVIVVDSFDSPRSSQTYAFDSPRESLSLESGQTVTRLSSVCDDDIPRSARRSSVSALAQFFEAGVTPYSRRQSVQSSADEISASFSICLPKCNTPTRSGPESPTGPQNIVPENHCQIEIPQPPRTAKRPPVPPPKPKKKNEDGTSGRQTELPLFKANICSVEKVEEMCTDIQTALDRLEAVAKGLEAVASESSDQVVLKEVVVVEETKQRKKTKKNKKKKKKQCEVSTQTAIKESETHLKAVKPTSLSDSAISSAPSVEEEGDINDDDKIHCRLFRILTDEPESEAGLSCTRSAASPVDTASEAPSLADESENMSVIMRRGRTRRQFIPSKVFQFLQSEFEDGTGYHADEERSHAPLSRQSSLLSPTTPSSSALELEQIFAQFAARK